MKETIPIDLFRIRCSVFFTQFPNTSNLSNKSSRCSVEKIPCNFDLWQIYIYFFFFFQIYTNCTRVMFTTFFYRINHQYVSVYAQKYQLQSIFYRFQPWRVFLFFFLIYPIIHFPSYDRAIYWKIFEEHSGTPIYRQNKVIERENRAQQIYSMRNICVRMCTCLYIYRER